MTYFFDTYALIEMHKSNPSHEKFKECKIVTGLLNLGELHFVLQRSLAKEESRKIIEALNPELIELDQETLLTAMEFKRKHVKKDMSMVDCIGYLLAKKAELVFVTGDAAFEKVEGVEWVK